MGINNIIMDEFDFDRALILRTVGEGVMREMREDYDSLLCFGYFRFIKKRIFKNKLSKEDYSIALANYLYFVI